MFPYPVSQSCCLASASEPSHRMYSNKSYTQSSNRSCPGLDQSSMLTMAFQVPVRLCLKSRPSV